MPQCSQCMSFYPSDFIEDIKDSTNPSMTGKKICHFCMLKTDAIPGTDNKIYKKDEVIYDYELFTKKLSENDSLRKKMNTHIVDKAIKNM